VAIAQIELGRVNATDLARRVDIAVNRVRSQLLALEAMNLLAEVGGGEGGRRMFEVQNRDDLFWAFVQNEFEEACNDADTRSLYVSSRLRTEDAQEAAKPTPTRPEPLP